MIDIKKIAEQMTKSYEEADIPLLSCRQLPDKKEIISILEDLKSLFFPAYFGNADCQAPQEFSEQLLSSIYYRIKKQIELALSFNSDECVKDKAEKIAEQFISELPSIHKLLIKDVHATFGKNLRRGSGIGGGQLQHQIGAAAHRHLGPCQLVRHSRLAPLDEVAAHGADNGSIRPQKGTGALQLQQMPPVEGIVLCYNTSNGHVIPPKFMTKK